MNVLKRVLGFILSLFSILCIIYYVYILIYDYIVCRRLFYISETTFNGYVCHKLIDTEYAWKFPVVIIIFIVGIILIKKSGNKEEK